MGKVTLHNIKSNGSMPLYSVVAIPQYSNIPKYMKFRNFLENSVVDVRYWPSCDNENVGALDVINNEVSINTEKCMGCLLCLSTNTRLTELAAAPNKILSEIYPPETVNRIRTKSLFNGEIFPLPTYSYRKTTSFEEYTSTNETTHISLWATSALRFLSSVNNPKIGKEIEIKKSSNPRDGRLDLCVESSHKVLVGEAKVDLDSLLVEDRYRFQIPNYQLECQKFIDEFNKKYEQNKKLQVYLIIGGRETDLLPESHPECSSLVGNKSSRFYRDIIDRNIKFISANAILVMLAYSIYHSKKICWDLFLDRVFDNRTYGLLTAGTIVQQDSKVIVNPIHQSLIEAAEKAVS